MAEKRSLMHISNGVFGLYDHPLVKALHKAGVTIRGIQEVHYKKEHVNGEKHAITVSCENVDGTDPVKRIDEIISEVNDKPMGENRTLLVGRVTQFGETDLAKQRFRRRLSLLGFGLDRELPEGWHVIEVVHAEKQASAEEIRKARLSLTSVAGQNTAVRTGRIREQLRQQASHVRDRQAQTAEKTKAANVQTAQDIESARAQLRQQLSASLSRRGRPTES